MCNGRPRVSTIASVRAIDGQLLMARMVDVPPLLVNRSSSRSGWRHRPSVRQPTANPMLHRRSPLPIYFRVSHTFVNVRAGPSVHSRLLARRFEGECFTADDERDGWVRDGSTRYGSADGWLLVDGASLGLGSLLERVDEAAAAAVAPAPSKVTLERFMPLITRPPKPASSDGPLPPGLVGPVRRWRVLRPLSLVHGGPSRGAPVVDVALDGEFVWSAAVDGASPIADWVRLAEPDGWVHLRCPAGHEQLGPPDEYPHRGRPDRELEALDLYCQARVAVHSTHGPGGRLELPRRFRSWEDEAISIGDAAEERPGQWSKVKDDRALAAASPFAQGLLSVCHRDVVLDAQAAARKAAARPEDCRRARLPGERPLTLADVTALRRDHLVAIDDVLPASLIARCCAEAEALDASGHLQPPAMHRALGDRRDRLVGLDAGSDLLPHGSALSQLVSYLKSLAFDLVTLGYDEPLSVPASVMLACYDGQGAFYKPHLDSATTDPRRLTAIVYLVPADWDARPQADGGQLNWWTEREEGEASTRHTLDPAAGRLVLFRARSVMHEVLPTHRKRFALTLWYFDGSELAS